MINSRITRYLFFLSFFIISNLVLAQEGERIVTNHSNIRLAFTLSENGHPHYTVHYKNNLVLKPSGLGFILNDSFHLENDFQVIQIDSQYVDETWKPVWGEVSQIRNHYKQLSIHLRQNHAPNLLLNIVFRIFEDGIGFRYEFPLQSNLKYFIIKDELTEFNLTGDHKTFWIPGDYDSNEYPYTTSPLSQVDAWKIPLISFEQSTEANLTNMLCRLR